MSGHQTPLRQAAVASLTSAGRGWVQKVMNGACESSLSLLWMPGYDMLGLKVLVKPHPVYNRTRD